MTPLLLATGNLHKAREFAAVLEPLGVHIELAPAGFAVDEDGVTFRDNALKKAAALAASTGRAACADDSGLEVDALGGAPGVHSARYAGVAAGPDQDAANRHKLLDALRGVPAERRASRFVCAIAYCAPGAEPRFFEGHVPGRIALEAQGQGGFGYDPLFVPDGEALSFAQMPAERKNALSHRGHALRALARSLGAV